MALSAKVAPRWPVAALGSGTLRSCDKPWATGGVGPRAQAGFRDACVAPPERARLERRALFVGYRRGRTPPVAKGVAAGERTVSLTPSVLFAKIDALLSPRCS